MPKRMQNGDGAKNASSSCIYKTPRLSWGSVKLTAMSRQNDSLRI